MINENVIQINVDVSVKGFMYVKKYIWNPSLCKCKNWKYLASIMDNSAIMCDAIIESNNEEINFNEKKATCKTQNFYILLAFVLFTTYYWQLIITTHYWQLLVFTVIW